MVDFPKIPYFKKNLKTIAFVLSIIPVSLFHGLSLQNKKSPFRGDFLPTGIPI